MEDIPKNRPLPNLSMMRRTDSFTSQYKGDSGLTNLEIQKKEKESIYKSAQKLSDASTNSVNPSTTQNVPKELTSTSSLDQEKVNQEPPSSLQEDRCDTLPKCSQTPRRCEGCTAIVNQGSPQECRSCYFKITRKRIKDEQHLENTKRYFERYRASREGRDLDEEEANGKSCGQEADPEHNRYACEICFVKDSFTIATCQYKSGTHEELVEAIIEEVSGVSTRGKHPAPKEKSAQASGKRKK